MMKTKRVRIFDTPAAQFVPPVDQLASDREFSPINYNPQLQAYLNKNDVLAKQTSFRKSKVYKRASSADHESSNYVYQVRNHIHAQGNAVDFCCSAMGCNIVDVSQADHRKHMTEELKQQILAMKFKGKQKDGDYVYAKQKPPNKSPIETLSYSQSNNHSGRTSVKEQGYHASYIPNTDPVPARKNIFIGDSNKNRYRSSSVGQKRTINIALNLLKRNIGRNKPLETINEESQTSKMQSANSQQSVSVAASKRTSIQ